MNQVRAIAEPIQRLVESVVMSVLGFAARKYVAGTSLADAAQLAAKASAKGLNCTLCYWNDGSEDPAIVAENYASIIELLACNDPAGALAVKLPALWENEGRIGQIVALARRKGVQVIFDAHAPDQAEAVLRCLERHGGEGLGIAIPGRWRRSLEDADRAVALGARIRVVKGEWPDPGNPGIDLHEGYLNVIRRLAGKARFVGVATHDVALSAQAMQILADAGTPFEQEFIFPLPISAALREGTRHGAGARVYIAYGEAWLPYSMKRAFRNPKTFYWLVRDLLLGKRFAL